ncbi:argininosuccinate synthase [Candidatus Saccharibacteria bacterium]|nr:argininosuccinate synthase [Candidatus Saccharibacteria bacterium]
MKKTTKYIKIASHEAKKGSFDTCLLLYSGGLDTSVMLKWIQDEYKCSVITLTLDIGQQADDLETIKQKALKLGAKKAYVFDAKKMFADTLLSHAIKANADYQGGYALSTPLGRVVIAKLAVEFAELNNCQVIAHGCTGKGNDQVRFEAYITTLNKNLKTIAPVREWGMGRQEEIAYANKHGIEVRQNIEKPYSYDENMWGNTGEGGEIENPSLQPKLSDILLWCKTIENTPEKAVQLQIEFEKGVPIKLNGESMELANLVAECNNIGGEHGVGVVQLIEDRLVGLKVRGVYENPGATILISAHKKLEQLVSTREENQFKSLVDTKWAYMVYGAQWFEPTMRHLNSYIDSQNMKVTGNVTVELFKGNVNVVALSSPYSLFDENLATFEKNQAFNQNASAGFIEIYNLSQKTAYGVYNYED